MDLLKEEYIWRQTQKARKLININGLNWNTKRKMSGTEFQRAGCWYTSHDLPYCPRNRDKREGGRGGAEKKRKGKTHI